MTCFDAPQYDISGIGSDARRSEIEGSNEAVKGVMVESCINVESATSSKRRDLILDRKRGRSTPCRVENGTWTGWGPRTFT